MLPEHFKLDTTPIASSEAVVRVGNARFTVLTERLIRLEYQPDGNFEDRASQTMWYRAQPVPAFTVQRDSNQTIIETAAFSLCYEDGQPFTSESLSIRLKASDTIWHPGDVDTDNLKGTTRTLDFTNGFTLLTDGLISRSGWALVDDSKSFVFNQDWWLEPRTDGGTDWYFFAYGHDYKAGLRDYCAVSGQTPLVPRWILGNWWSRYWAYSQADFVNLLNDFEAHEIPLSVCIIDMDWHITETGNASSGWTGYTWNRELIPDPQGLIDFMHDKNLRTALNLHPAQGVHSHEEQYPEMARRMGIDPASKQPIEFDITDPTFVNAYFELLHHPYEAMGVDFWWVDWQQGQTCKIPKLDPLWLINHLHFYDAGRHRAKRPFIFSRWGNEGHQRYPIGFSGDSYMTWDTLGFESYMTATASNVAYMWWSHDIGGHTSGTGDAELFTRWIQFGVLSPIMRIHSTKGYFYDQRPWGFENAEVRAVLRDTMQFRHALIPYLYTMAWKAHQDSAPLMQPMYYEYPEADAAYHCPQQYLFGAELIAAPFVEPADPDTGLSRQVVWLPEGDWIHFFTGEHYEGDRWHAIYGLLKDIPLFAKAGAILPMNANKSANGSDNPAELRIDVFAGADNTFTLYEDDGDSRNYLSGDSCQTTITQTWSGDQMEVIVHPAMGNTRLIPVERSVKLCIHGVKDSAYVNIAVNGERVASIAAYDTATETMSIEPVMLTPNSTLSVRLHTDEASLLSRRDRKRENLLRMLRAFRLHSGVRNRLAEMIDTVITDPDTIAPYTVTMSAAHIRALCEVLYEAGAHRIPDAHHPDMVVLWNNRGDDAITYRYSEAFLHFGMVKDAKHERGSLPKFAAIIPTMQTWTHGALNQNVQRTQWQVEIDYHQIAGISEGHRERTP